MTLRNLPPVDLGARPGVRSDISQSALSRWSPDLRAAVEGEDDATITILDVIGQDFWGDGVTAKRISAALRRIGDRPATVVINSPGGDVFEGLAIYNLLREHKQKITVKVVGLAASAASFIAMAGDEIQIARAGFFMIHNSWVIAMGDRFALREVADWLEPFDATMAEIYAARSGQTADELAKMMNEETWLNGSRSVDLGLADGFLPRDEIEVSPEDDTAKGLRAERMFDVLASRAGLSRTEGKDLLASLKGGKPGAASTGALDAAVLEPGLQELQSVLNSLKGK